MPEIKFKSLNKADRTATFSVDGATVQRRIPKQFDGSIDGYIQALAVGLSIEFADDSKVINTPTIKTNSVVIAADPGQV